MKLIDRFFSRRDRYKLDKRLTSDVESRASSRAVERHAAVMLGNVQVLFGLDWTTASASQTYEQFLQAERKKGQKSYIAPLGSDIVGFSEWRASSRLHSAAIYLSETVSHGGSEFFVFDLSSAGRAGMVGVVALVDRLPVPGFDCVCDQNDVARLLTEFWALQPQDSVRVAGTLASIDGIEEIKLIEIFDNTIDIARMVAIPNPVVRSLLAVGVLGVFATIGLGYHWHKERQAQELAAQAKEVPDPNIAYEAQVIYQLQSVGLSGAVMMRSWVDIIKNLPTSIKGWELAKIACLPTECTSTWRYVYGSYEDLLSSGHSALDVSTANLPFVSSLQEAQVEFKHPIATFEQRSKMNREALPTVTEAQRELGSTLQNHMLLGAKGARLSTPSLFGGNGVDISEIKKPVVKGGFAVELPFASIQEFHLPEYCVLTAMDIDFPSDTKGRFDKVFFNIQGDFYAKNKVY